MSEWRDVYRRFNRVRRNWLVHQHPGVNDQLFRASVLSSKTDEEAIYEFDSLAVDPPPAPLWDEARWLRQHMQFPAEGRHHDDPCEDVYQAALTMMPFGVWTASPAHDQLYRGQRDARWPVVPSLFRVPTDERGAAVERVNMLAEGIMQERPELSADQSLALLQHFSAELRAPTWLLDLTWDPAVALMFASMGSVDGDIGVVTMVVRKEWQDLSAGGRNRLGEIRVIDVPGIVRIDRQRALFLDTSHPDLFEQYVAHSVWFRQVENLVFEDPDAEWPVTVERCIPKVDGALEMLRRIESEGHLGTGGVALAPASDASAPLGPDDYADIAASWCEQAGVELGPHYTEVLNGVSRVYSALQREREHVGVTLRSLFRLEEATEAIMRHQQARSESDVASALWLLLSRSKTGDERALLEQLIEEAASQPLIPFVMRLLNDLPQQLAELVLIGVRDDKPQRVQADIEAALAAPLVRVFDLRGVRDANGIAALATDAGESVRLLLVDAATSTDWMARLTRAVLDGRDRVRFEEGWVARPTGQSIVLVHYGATDITDLPPALQQIPIIQFI
jgi:hypothetical protein